MVVRRPNELKKTFPEAECLQRPETFPEIRDILKKHTAIFGDAKPVLTEVGVSESVPFQRKVPNLVPIVTSPAPPSGDVALAELVGDAVAASKTRPASRPPSVESAPHIGVLKVRLFLQMIWANFSDLSRGNEVRCAI